MGSAHRHRACGVGLLTTWAVSLVKDEADVIEGTIRHMADEVDGVIVADNASTDGTRDILDKLATELNLIVVDDTEVGYHQSFKMSALAEKAAREHGATWVVAFDADELWMSATDRVSVDLASAHGNVATAALFNHFPTAVDPDGDDPFRTIVWRQPAPAPLPKVAFRWEPGAVIHQGNHAVTLPSGETPVEMLEIRHFPHRTPDQFIRKVRNGAAAYAATSLPAHVGQHWREWGVLLDRIGEERLVEEVWMRWYHFTTPVEEGMLLDPAPYMRWRTDA